MSLTSNSSLDKEKFQTPNCLNLQNAFSGMNRSQAPPSNGSNKTREQSQKPDSNDSYIESLSSNGNSLHVTQSPSKETAAAMFVNTDQIFSSNGHSHTFNGEIRGQGQGRNYIQSGEQ